MNKQIEALKMAIEALENIFGWQRTTIDILDVHKACKEALAEAEKQEPVAFDEEVFNTIAYAYRTCPAHEVKMVSERYQDLLNYVLSLMEKNHG